MSSDLISIARSGTSAARLGLDVTAQNIANASTPGYVRRSVALEEVAGLPAGRSSAVSLNGVRLTGIVRNADATRTSEVRRTAGDLARAEAELSALTAAEAAIGQTGLSDALSAFEFGLQALRADPTNAAARASVMGQARSLADSMNAAAASLDAARGGLEADAATGVSQLNRLSADLHTINTRLQRAAEGSSDQAALLDRRDALLQSMGELAGISVTIGDRQTASVTLAGVALVGSGGAEAVAVGIGADGNLAFSLDGGPITISSGALAGTALGLSQLNDAQARLDAVAASVIGVVNAAQANGVALDGTAGQPLFGGTGAGNIRLLTPDGSSLATAPAGAAPESRNSANLDALIADFASTGIADQFDRLLTDVSSAVAARSITRDSLAIVAEGARSVLAAQAGVSLDDEAANLLRFQQAFQASGRVMQVARDLFDTMIGIG